MLLPSAMEAKKYTLICKRNMFWEKTNFNYPSNQSKIGKWKQLWSVANFISKTDASWLLDQNKISKSKKVEYLKTSAI